MRIARCALFLPVLLPAVFLVACGEQDQSFSIDEVRPGRAPQIQRGAGLTHVERLSPRVRPGAGSHPGSGSQAQPGPPPELIWKLPDGWKELPATQYRKANFTLERSAEVECYFSVTGGGLMPNVNRWYRQMKQSPVTEEVVAGLSRHPLFKGQAALVDLEGDFAGMSGKSRPEFRMLGLILPLSGDQVLSVKMTGPKALVAEEKANFLALCASFALKVQAGVTWTAPEGWVESESRGERLVSFHPAGDKTAECYVFAMAADGGGLADNLNRWQRQMGQPALPDAAIEALPRISVFGEDRHLLEAYGAFTGMTGKRIEDAGMLAVPCFLGSRAVFVKLTGPAQLVRDEKENFIAFCRSLAEEES